MSGLDNFMKDYSRRYIRTGSGAPVFHVMGVLFTVGVVFHAKQHYDHKHDPAGHHH